MPVEFNLQGDCTVNLLGSGLDSCVALYGDLVGIDLFLKGTFAIDTTSGTFPDETAYKLRIQQKTLFPLNNIFEFEQTTPDNELATSSRGITKEIRAGKPAFSITWSDGGCFHEQVFDKQGQDTWDIAMKFEKGVVYAKNIAGTILKPFTNGIFSVGTFKIQQGTDPDQTIVNIQFPTAEEWNSRKTFYTWVAIGYDQSLINGVLNTIVDFEGSVTASTTFSVSVVSRCNESVIITGLDDPNEWKLNGAQASTTTISQVVFNAATNQYDFTVTPTLIATDTLQPSLADVTATLDVAINSAGDFYQGQDKDITVLT